MNFFETLRKFKTIKPDPSYTEVSKRAILASSQHTPAMSPFRGVLQFIETGAAVVLAGFFILLITGALSNSSYIAPVQYSVIDAAGLHAEAQAIDIQIQLAEVNYPNVTSSPATSGGESTALAPSANPRSLSAAMTAATSSALAVSSATETAAATSTSIDAALRQLSQ